MGIIEANLEAGATLDRRTIIAGTVLMEGEVVTIKRGEADDWVAYKAKRPYYTCLGIMAKSALPGEYILVYAQWSRWPRERLVEG